MVTAKRTAKRRKTQASRADLKIHPAVKQLEESLSSPRLKAQGTISTYIDTAVRFLSGLPDGEKPTESDFRQYFIRRRKAEVSERTLRKEFFHLKKFAESNRYVWPFNKNDTPYPIEDALTPALRPEEVEQLITAREKLSEAERFFLAVATTWIVRREDMCRIKKRDYDDTYFTIYHSKKGKIVKHLIPDELKRVFADYRPKTHTPQALSLMFERICAKAGLPRKKGVGWHGLRRTLTTMITTLLPTNNLDPALIADYSGWRRSSLGNFFGGVSMVGVYRRPEILDSDPYGTDRTIYGIHPFLPLWGKKSKK